MSSLLLAADVLEGLASLRDSSVHTVVTSPPYWGMRDYKTPSTRWEDGWVGQLGLEPDYRQYVDHLVFVMRALRRVLRPEGVLWLNIGDCHATDSGAGKSPGGGSRGQDWIRDSGHQQPNRRKQRGLKRGDLACIPWRAGLALQEDGWVLRQTVVWGKTNPTPESLVGWSWSRCQCGSECERCRESGPVGYVRRRGRWRPTTSHELILMLTSGEYFAAAEAAAVRAAGGGSRNPRSVWHFANSGRPNRGEHHSTFPEKLVRRCLASAPLNVCSACGSPWAPVVDSHRTFDGRRVTSWRPPPPAWGNRWRRSAPQGVGHHRFGRSRRIVAWHPTCECEADSTKAVVLDPFCGSGTTGLVSLQTGRRFVGIDRNARYLDMAERRLAAASLLPLFDRCLESDA